MPKPEHTPAEDLLIEEDVFSNKSAPLRAVLGCMGCKWLGTDGHLRFLSREPAVSATEIMECTQLPKTTVNQILGILKQEGAITWEQSKEPLSNGRKVRLIEPADTKLGMQLYGELQIPYDCPHKNGS